MTPVFIDVTTLRNIALRIKRALFLSAEFKRLDDRATLPAVAHDGDVGYDVYALDDVILSPGISIVRTGVALTHCSRKCFPKIEGRSSIAIQAAFPIGGIIDPIYLGGEIKVVMCNVSGAALFIGAKQKIAQIVFYRHAHPAPKNIVLSTDRKGAGFGSTDDSNIRPSRR